MIYCPSHFSDRAISHISLSSPFFMIDARCEILDGSHSATADRVRVACTIGIELR